MLKEGSTRQPRAGAPAHSRAGVSEAWVSSSGDLFPPSLHTRPFLAARGRREPWDGTGDRPGGARPSGHRNCPSALLTVFTGWALPVVAARPEGHRTLIRGLRVGLIRDELSPASVVGRNHVRVSLLEGPEGSWGESDQPRDGLGGAPRLDRKSTRLNSSH